MLLSSFIWSLYIHPAQSDSLPEAICEGVHEPRDRSCFDFEFTCKSCCDTHFSAEGHFGCWASRGLQYGHCCPKCPIRSQPSCFTQETGLSCASCCKQRDACDFASKGFSYDFCCLGVEQVCGFPAHAQGGQDAFVSKFFECMEGGSFIDIGAFDGYQLSSTASLERYLGWTGVCIDANPNNFDDRTCSVIQAVLSDKDDEYVMFRVDHPDDIGQGGIGSTSCITQDPAHEHDEYTFMNATTVSLDTIFRHAPPMVVDFVSVDVEGHEVKVLQGFPFDKFCVRLFLIEGNDVAGIKALLYSKGYFDIGTVGLDWIFVPLQGC